MMKYLIPKNLSPAQPYRKEGVFVDETNECFTKAAYTRNRREDEAMQTLWRGRRIPRGSFFGQCLPPNNVSMNCS
jgi:hypothetical protein